VIKLAKHASILIGLNALHVQIIASISILTLENAYKNAKQDILKVVRNFNAFPANLRVRNVLKQPQHALIVLKTANSPSKIRKHASINVHQVLQELSKLVCLVSLLAQHASILLHNAFLAILRHLINISSHFNALPHVQLIQ